VDALPGRGSAAARLRSAERKQTAREAESPIYRRRAAANRISLAAVDFSRFLLIPRQFLINSAENSIIASGKSKSMNDTLRFYGACDWKKCICLTLRPQKASCFLF